MLWIHVVLLKPLRGPTLSILAFQCFVWPRKSCVEKQIWPPLVILSLCFNSVWVSMIWNNKMYFTCAKTVSFSNLVTSYLSQCIIAKLNPTSQNFMFYYISKQGQLDFVDRSLENKLVPFLPMIINGCLDSVEWNGGIELWTGWHINSLSDNESVYLVTYQQIIFCFVPLHHTHLHTYLYWLDFKLFHLPLLFLYPQIQWRT